MLVGMVLDDRLARSCGRPPDEFLDVTSCPASDGDERRVGSAVLPSTQGNVVKDDRDDISIDAEVPSSAEVPTNAGGCCSGGWDTFDKLWDRGDSMPSMVLGARR